MANDTEPVVGQWYLHHDKGEMFHVAAIDPDDGSIEVQFFDGDVEELTADQWRALDVETCDAPADWTGPYDDIETDDLDYTETGMTGRDWRTPLESLPPGAGAEGGARPEAPEEAGETGEEEEASDWGEGRQLETFLEDEDAAKRRVQ